jgi:hypothetical protein
MAATENRKKESALQAILFLMTNMMSYGLFICATLILPITAVNKNQVPYAVHPDPRLVSVQKQTCSDYLIMVLNCSVGMVL